MAVLVERRASQPGMLRRIGYAFAISRVGIRVRVEAELHDMNITATGGAERDAPDNASDGHAQGSLAKLAVGAVGIVFGDIGTSPIYAFRETFAGHHTLVPDQLHIYGVLSLIFWSMMIIVTLKYVTI